MESDRKNWDNIAITWDVFTSPLRVCQEDVDAYNRIVNKYRPNIGNEASAQILLLGVTREIAQADSIGNVQITAVDNNIEMIRNIWKGNANPESQAICGDWRSLPVPSGSKDICIGDGCFSTMTCGENYGEVVQDVARSLKPGGLFLIRLFVKPAIQEVTQQLLKEFEVSKPYNFHAWKFRIAMMLSDEQNNFNVEMNKVAMLWKRYFQPLVDVGSLSKEEYASMLTIERFEGKAVVYSFPTLKYMENEFSKCFEVLDRYYCPYELGQCCPILVLRKK